MPIVYDKKTELRKDYFLDKYVIITPARTKRPHDIVETSHRKPGQKCVLCPNMIEKGLIVDTIGGKKNWHVASILNKFPAISLINPKAYGQQEVIIETPLHGKELGDMTIKETLNILKMYQKRTKFLSSIKGIEYILIFKNMGGPAGASLLHSHSQIFASKKTPPDVFVELDKAQEYKLKHGHSIYEDIIKKEIKSPRLIWKDKNVIVFCPFAPMYHYETWIFPLKKRDNITELTKNELLSIAKAFKIILSKLNNFHIPYNFFMHQSIPDKDQHFYIKIQPRESIWAGLELGAGIVINSISPEKAAKFYRKK
jgi:UDPglucose--hexose-1-phosphate uridylyltransferase